MARWVTLATLLVNAIIIGAVPHPDAPLSVAYASLPLQTKSSVPASVPQYAIRPFANNAAYTSQFPATSNPALLVAAPSSANQSPNFINFYSPNPGQSQRIFASPAQSSPQGTIVQIVPAQDGAQAQRVTSPPRNFVTFTRAPPQQQFIPSQSPAEQQFLGQRALFVAAPRQATEQPSAVPNQPQASSPRQFGIRTVFASPGPSANFAPLEQGATGGSNPVPAQQSAVRTVVVISPRQAGLQSPQGDAGRRPTPLPQPLKPRVFLGSSNRANEQPLPSSPAASAGPSANLISSTQFFSRNFGNTGTVTYFVQPLAVPAGVAPTANRPGADVEA